MSEPSLPAADLELLGLVARGSGASVDGLCESLGVTATAVRQRLSRLLAAGLLDRTAVREGRGRPRHAYSLTSAGRRSLGTNYSELAFVLWDELRSVEDERVRALLFAKVQDALVRRYGGETGRAGTLGERLGRLRAALVSHGFDVEVDDSGPLPVLRENHCPYHDLAEADADICELEQRVFERVLGTDVSLTRCCRDGDGCCEFSPASLDPVAVPVGEVTT